MSGHGLPERLEHAAVLAAVKARPLGVRAKACFACRPALTGVCARRPRRSAVGAGEACGAVEQRKWAEEGGPAPPSCTQLGSHGEGLTEEIELARIRVGLGRDCLVVAPDLGVVVVLEVERELHQGVGDVGRSLVGNGELMLLFCAAFAGHRLYSAISPLVR